MDWQAHYKQVRERIARQPLAPVPVVTLPPPRLREPDPMPEPVPEPPPPEGVTAEDMVKLFIGASLSRTVKDAAAPILKRHGLTWCELFTVSRCKVWQQPRREVWKALRDAGLSYPRIGRLTGRDHSTIVYGVTELEKQHVG